MAAYVPVFPMSAIEPVRAVSEVALEHRTHSLVAATRESFAIRMYQVIMCFVCRRDGGDRDVLEGAASQPEREVIWFALSAAACAATVDPLVNSQLRARPAPALPPGMATQPFYFDRSAGQAKEATGARDPFVGSALAFAGPLLVLRAIQSLIRR
jgi:hypothetical protein